MGYVWDYTLRALPYELEVQEGATLGASQVYPLDAVENGGVQATVYLPPLRVQGSPSICTVRVGYWEQASGGRKERPALGVAAAARVSVLPAPPAALTCARHTPSSPAHDGRPRPCAYSRIERHAGARRHGSCAANRAWSRAAAAGRWAWQRAHELGHQRAPPARCLAHPDSPRNHAPPSHCATGPKALESNQPDLALTFELPGLEVSVVDHHPQELLLLTITDLKVVLLNGTNPSSGGWVRACVRACACARV